jgi:hypothetical protein
VWIHSAIKPTGPRDKLSRVLVIFMGPYWWVSGV